MCKLDSRPTTVKVACDCACSFYLLRKKRKNNNSQLASTLLDYNRLIDTEI